jgi:hypothetical protein
MGSSIKLFMRGLEHLQTFQIRDDYTVRVQGNVGRLFPLTNPVKSATIY